MKKTNKQKNPPETFSVGVCKAAHQYEYLHLTITNGKYTHC